ncbi:hypothetical protein BLOT_005540 [Blomia tropicalis]|nr:hypothetical protein BLOT_005540 [Blomia tropicalis]
MYTKIYQSRLFYLCGSSHDCVVLQKSFLANNLVETGVKLCVAQMINTIKVFQRPQPSMLRNKDLRLIIIPIFGNQALMNNLDYLSHFIWIQDVSVLETCSWCFPRLPMLRSSLIISGMRKGSEHNRFAQCHR